MATVFIDNRAYDVNAARNLLEVCLSLGFDLPYFCWMPALGSVGACRQCAVKQFRNERDRDGRLVMACMTPAAEGTRISIADPEAAAFRASVIEWLMTNHPHDCPVCDEGGECHLQDMTMMTGHAYRRYRFRKRTYRNQELGPFVRHDMNRCIQCYRCVRFYRDYAGGRDLNVFAAHDQVYFGRAEDGVLESPFSGNLVEVCPTGVFTDHTFMRHYTRKWDLQTAPSVCAHCSLGCNTTPGERGGRLRRIVNRYNSEINGYFLCDRGRFGYGHVNLDGRIRRPVLQRRDGGPRKAAPNDQAASDETMTRETVLRRLAARLAGGARLLGIGSPRASLEANFALRTLVGPERFSLGLGEAEAGLLRAVLDILRLGPARTPSLREVEEADAVLVLGEDVLHTAPRLALALRQSSRQEPLALADRLGIPRWDDAAVRNVLQDRQGPVFIASLRATGLDDLATETFHGAPNDLARLGLAVAHAIHPEAPAVGDMEPAASEQAERIAGALRRARRPLVVSGLSLRSRAVVDAAAQVAAALCAVGHAAGLSYALAECNSLGLALLGGASLEAAVASASSAPVDALIVVENDLFERGDADTIEGLLRGAGEVILLDHLPTATASLATAILPSGAFPEGDGSVVSQEGRAQRFYQVIPPRDEVQESWRWLRDLAEAGAGTAEVRRRMAGWRNLDDVVAALAADCPALAGVREAAPPAGLRFLNKKIPRQPKAYSGRTAVQAQVTVHEPPPPEDPDSPLAFSMEGWRGQPPSALITQFWAPGWNSIRSLNKFQEEVGGPLRHEMPGRRLIEPGGGSLPGSAVPPPFRPREREWLLLPLDEIFGSDETSARAPAMAERIPHPYLAMHPVEAERAGLTGVREVELDLGGRRLRLALCLDPTMPRGVAGIPRLPGLPVAVLPAWVQGLRRAPS